jgi:hypothetical protein
MSLEQAILNVVRAVPPDKQREVLSHVLRLQGEANACGSSKVSSREFHAASDQR